MIKYCYLNLEKLLKFTLLPIEEDDEDDYYADELNVRVLEDGEYVYYHFADYEAMDTFLLMLEMNDLEYDLVDENGDVIELDDDDYDFDDDEY